MKCSMHAEEEAEERADTGYGDWALADRKHADMVVAHKGRTRLASEVGAGRTMKSPLKLTETWPRLAPCSLLESLLRTRDLR